MPSLQARIDGWLRGRAPETVGPAEFAELMQTLGPVPEPDVRRRLRAAGIPLHPFAAGVNQDSFSALRDTLAALAHYYEESGMEERRAIRRIVITAKDHAKLAAHNPRVAPGHRREKEEMAAWMLTWLENPSVFPVWVALRSKTLPEFPSE